MTDHPGGMASPLHGCLCRMVVCCTRRRLLAPEQPCLAECVSHTHPSGARLRQQCHLPSCACVSSYPSVHTCARGADNPSRCLRNPHPTCPDAQEHTLLLHAVCALLKLPMHDICTREVRQIHALTRTRCLFISAVIGRQGLRMHSLLFGIYPQAHNFVASWLLSTRSEQPLVRALVNFEIYSILQRSASQQATRGGGGRMNDVG